MSTPQQPPDEPDAPHHGAQQAQWGSSAESAGYVPVSPLLGEDPPKIGDFWLDARLGAAPSGVAFTGHDEVDRPAVIILLSEGAAADAAARERFAGVINKMHIDVVYARGGHGQDTGRLARKFRAEGDDPVSPDERQMASWAALAYDGSPAAAAEAERVLDDVQLATLPQQGAAAGPDYRHYWIERVKPGLTRLWPLPWPGRYDRAGWRTILVSWLLMLLLAALAVLIAILIFRNQPPQAPPPPTGGSGSPPPQSSSPSPQSGSPSPQSGSPSPQSGSPAPQSGSPSPQSGSPSSPSSASPSGSPSSGSPSPSGTESGGGSPTPSDSGSPGGSSPGSRL
ncbi:MAG: hypothetical protein H0T91_03655 [Propionibacteriaceae bacterium]|nr:hypothetical protein [Propionibacteriaceae bacterium]